MHTPRHPPRQSKVRYKDGARRIKTREEPICSADTGHRTASMCHLANIGNKLRRKLTWDPAKEEFPGDMEASALITRKPRAAWEYA